MKQINENFDNPIDDTFIYQIHNLLKKYFFYLKYHRNPHVKEILFTATYLHYQTKNKGIYLYLIGNSFFIHHYKY